MAHHNAPTSDWVVYAVVLGVVALMVLGKYMMFSDEKKENDDKPKDN